jgi:hypothetical protein
MITSEGVAKLFFKYVYWQFGLYDKIISDRGPQFISKFSRALAKLLDCTIAPFTTYHPQTDGQTERLNQELTISPFKWLQHFVTVRAAAEKAHLLKTKVAMIDK